LQFREDSRRAPRAALTTSGHQVAELTDPLRDAGMNQVTANIDAAASDSALVESAYGIPSPGITASVLLCRRYWSIVMI
jgi:hypothetical protein